MLIYMHKVISVNISVNKCTNLPQCYQLPCVIRCMKLKINNQHHCINRGWMVNAQHQVSMGSQVNSVTAKRHIFTWYFYESWFNYDSKQIYNTHDRHDAGCIFLYFWSLYCYFIWYTPTYYYIGPYWRILIYFQCYIHREYNIFVLVDII